MRCPIYVPDFKETGSEVEERIELVQTTGVWRGVERVGMNNRIQKNW